MKKENIILLIGLICAAITSVAVFIPWHNFIDFFKLGEFGHFISNDFYNTYIGVVVVYMIVLVCKYRDLKGAFLQGCIILAVLTVFHLGIKLLIGEWTPRPSGNSGGFPSGHSQAVFALAFLVSIRTKKLTIPVFLFAMLCAWSRIYSTHYETGEPYEPAHYPYQVMFGSYFGVVFTYLMYKYLEPRREKILKVFCKPFVKISNLFKKK